MSDLQPDHYRDLLTYHGALKQFLSVSNASAKANPKRAAKAREKLLKLSATQFYELSTDVFDELERRIDESREEPDFLLPKSTFHPKRNEAREKLGSLQQGRFRDLVSDIFYEIERRDYHKTQQRASYHSFDYGGQRSSKGSNLNNDLNPSPANGNINKNGVVGLQSTTVIPTKAELAWSSDEGEDMDEKNNDKQHTIIQNQKSFSPSTSSPYHSPQKQQQYHQHQHSTDYQQLQSRSNRNSDLSSRNRNSNPSDKDVLSEMVDSAPKHSTAQVNRGLSLSKTRNKDREIELLLEEGTKMDQTITQLEQKIALLQSKSDKFENETKDLNKINQNLSSKVSSLEGDLSNKIEQLKQLEQNQKSRSLDDDNDKLPPTRNLQVDTNSGKIDQSALDELKNEVLDWRTKFENLKLQKIEDLLSIKTISQSSISNLLDNNGLIPLNLVNILHKSIESFLISLNKDKSAKSKTDVNTLFDHISKISNISGKIASFAPHSDKAELIRASISHSITSARYYALYSEFLPKLVVESAVSEIAFSVCDLISEVKLNKDDSKYSASEFELPNTALNGDEDVSNEISPVRPLRMTKKSFESPSSKNEHNTTTSSTTPRPLNLTFNSQGNNISTPSTSKKPYQGLNGLTSPITSAKKMEFGNKISPSSSSRDLKSNNDASGSNPSTPTTTTATMKKNAFPSVISRYSPESDRKSPESNTTTAPSLRKSSSSNILSKVRQFEQQGNGNGTVSPQRSVVSPFSDSKFGSGVRRTSVDSQPESIEVPKESNDFKRPAETVKTTDVKMNDSLKTSNEVPEVKNVEENIDKNTNQVSNQPTSKDSKISSLPIPVEAKGINYDDGEDDDDDDDEVDFTSIDKLKGAIKKNADLKPKPLKDELEEPIAVEDRAPKEEGDDEDLNELPNEEEYNNVENKTAQNPSELNKDVISKELRGDGLEHHNGNDGLKIERKQLNQAFVEPPSNLAASSKSIEPPIDNTVKSLNLGEHKATSIIEENLNPNPKSSDNGAQISQDDFKSAHEAVLSEDEQDEDGHDVQLKSQGTTTDVKSNGRNYRSEGRDLEEDFDVGQFDIEDPDNTLSELLLYLEHQTVKVISTIQTLLTSIKAADSTKGELRSGSRAINAVVSQMVDATSNSMNQSRNGQLREHGIWVVQSLEDSGRRMDMLCNSSSKDGEDNEDDNEDYADKHFKQRLAGIAFDVAKCTKELVKTVEEANLKEEIEHLDARLGH